MFDKRGQLAVFIIIAVVIVGIIVVFVAFRDRIQLGGVPRELAPVYSYYSECVEQETRTGIELLGVGGGRIDTGDYVPGSDYSPFSSHLLFLGSPIRYWYTISGNNLIKENAPTKKDMETELADFIETRIEECDFSPYYLQGFLIEQGEADVKTTISDGDVKVNVKSPLSVSLGEVKARKNIHDVDVKSNLGKFHNQALDIYNKEKSEAFLEEYAVDVLRSYAPVDGVEVQCSPKIWKSQEVVDELKSGLEANFAAIKFKGNYYNIARKEDNYFVVNHNVESATRVIYSRDWASKIEITPGDENLMVAEPVGNQEGLGILGFCYVPYHFVYDVAFPALIQIYEGEEVFQFPVVVIVDNNVPRNPLAISVESQFETDICEFKEGSVKVRTYDTNLNPIKAQIAYQCFEQTCQLGETIIKGQNAELEADVPLCVNGFLIARAENYSEVKQLFSSNSEGEADIILEREREVKVKVLADGQELSKDTSVVVHFAKQNGKISSAVLPETDKVRLGEGFYNISVFVYGNSSVVIPSTTKTQCVTTPKGGLFGLFGQTKEECFEIKSPETRIDYALRGGGKAEDIYILESELEEGQVTLFVNSLPKPNSMEQLQNNFEIFTGNKVELSFP